MAQKMGPRLAQRQILLGGMPRADWENGFGDDAPVAELTAWYKVADQTLFRESVMNSSAMETQCCGLVEICPLWFRDAFAENP
jgi:hypothetical protein